MIKHTQVYIKTRKKKEEEHELATTCIKVNAQDVNSYTHRKKKDKSIHVHEIVPMKNKPHEYDAYTHARAGTHAHTVHTAHTHIVHTHTHTHTHNQGKRGSSRYHVWRCVHVQVSERALHVARLPHSDEWPRAADRCLWRPPHLPPPPFPPSTDPSP